MTRRIYVFDPPDRLVVGAVGRPGHRNFYLQARRGDVLVTVGLEKAQVAVVADRIGALLEAVRRAGLEGAEEATPTATAALSAPVPETQPSAELEEPVEEAFRVGTITLGWDPDEQVVVFEAREELEDEDEEADDVDDDAEEGPDVVRLRVPAAEAAAFADRALRIVAAGRPPCPVCGEPLNPEGHLCARRNGFVH
jgi:uncharacterized repeat protein (TIGR03847 family)